MPLDYTIGSVNFRDVGEFVNLIAGKKLMNEGVLFRGGKTDFCETANEIGNPKTIINLRKGEDKKSFKAKNLHFPISNDHEKYITTKYEVRMWLNDIFRTFENPALKHPVFVHCLSGKDRTGIVIGIILTLTGISREIIVEEYLLSDGDVNKEMFIGALNGLGDIDGFFDRVDLGKITQNLKKWYLVP